MTSDEELRDIQQTALDHAIEEMAAADALGIKTAKDRGDRSWLTGMAAKSLGVAVRIEQFIALRNGKKANDGDDDDQEKAAKDKMVKTARTEVAKILERAGVGPKQRDR